MARMFGRSGLRVAWPETTTVLAAKARWRAVERW